MKNSLPNPPALSILLANRNKQLPNYCYKYAGEGNKAQYGFDAVFPEHLEVDESSMSLWIPFANGSNRDGVGDLLEIGGIRLERHQKNPIVLFDHGKEVKLPIAKALDPASNQYTVELDVVNQVGRLRAFFYDGKGLDGVDRTQDYNHALFCEQLYDLTAKGFIRGGSIGYQVIKALELPPDYGRGIPKGLHLLQTLMLEGSLVVMPANADTVRKGLDWEQQVQYWTANSVDAAREILSMPNVCGKSLSPMLVKTLTPFAKATPRYVDKPPEKYGMNFGDAPYTTEKIGSAHFAVQGGHTEAGEARGGSPVSGKPHATREGAANSAIRHGLRDTLGDEMKRRKKGVGGAITGARIGATVGSAVPGVGTAVGALAGAAIGHRVTKSEELPNEDEKMSVHEQNHPKTPVEHYSTLRQEDANTPVLSNASKPKKDKLGQSEVIRRQRSQAEYALGYKAADEIKPKNERYVSAGKGKTRTARISEPQKGSDEEIKTSRKPTQLKKDLGSIRKKYVVTKSLRRRIKSSKPGSSIVYVGSKDMKKAREAASSRGLKFVFMGESKGANKIKLTGDDDSIDCFARDFGKPIRMNTKSLEINDSKSLGEDMGTKSNKEELSGPKRAAGNVGPKRNQEQITYSARQGLGRDKIQQRKPTQLNKDFDEFEGEVDNTMATGAPTTAEPEADIEMAAESDTPQEKYGAQVLRRLHQDAAILLGEYDEFVELLESDKVKKTLTRKLEHLASFLEEVEGLFGSEYPDGNPLEGVEIEGEEKIMEEVPEDEAAEMSDIADEDPLEDAVEDGTIGDGDDAGSGAGDEMDDRGERAVAGDSDDTVEELDDEDDEVMEGIGMGAKRFKGLRGKYKAAPKEQRYSPPSIVARRGKFPTRQEERYPKTKDPKTQLKKAMEECPKCGEQNCQCEVGETDQKIAPLVAAGVGMAAGSMMGKALESHEKTMVGGAAKYLFDMGQDGSMWDDEKKMDAHHYYKTLDGMVTLQEAYDDLHDYDNVPPSEWEPGAGAMKAAVPAKPFRNRPSSNARPAGAAPAAADSQVGQNTIPGGGGHKPPAQSDSIYDSDYEQGDNPYQFKGDMHPHRKMCKDASEFFRELSQTRDFGDPHREKCKYWHRNLDPISKEEDIAEEDLDEEVIEETDGEEAIESEEEETEVGERGEKASDEIQPTRRPRTHTDPVMRKIVQDSGGTVHQRVREQNKRRFQQDEQTGKGPGSRPMRIPKEPTTHVPKKQLTDTEEKALIAQQTKQMEELNKLVASISI